MKRNGIFKILLSVAVMLLAMGCVFCGFNQNATAYAQTKTYKTANIISRQGENGFYYAWGTAKNYVLMEYGPVWGGNSDGWHGLEGYQTVNGQTLHPGNYWGVMIVWVANESGIVSLDGMMQKGSSNGDGANLGVYHQKYRGDLITIEEHFTRSYINFEVKKEITVKKGDTIIFYCDSGIAKDNNSDSCGFPFTITYTQTNGDTVENEDLSVYLNAGRAGAIGGFEHVEPKFEAEVLDGTLTEKVVTVTEGCGAMLSSPLLFGISLVSLVMIWRKRR